VANTLLTIQMITNEALALLENELTFTKFVNRQYDDSFGVRGAKIGDTLNVRKPVRFVGRTGQAIGIENVTETSIPVQLTTQAGVDFSFSSADLTLRIDDFAERYLKPAVANIANRIDRDGLVMATNATYNSVGTPGTALTDGNNLLLAGALLDDNDAPRGGGMRAAVWSAKNQAAVVKGLQGLFNAPDKISEQFNTGNLGKFYGFKNSMDQNVINRVVGPLGGAPLVNGAAQTGNTLVTDGWTAAAASRLLVGDTFTIAGVFSVNPQSRQNTGTLQQFVVTAPFSSDGAGTGSISISPAITPTGAYQNVTNSPADNAAITVVGAAGTLTTQNLAYHRDAFTLVTADLPLPGGVDMAARKSDPQTGTSIRVVRAYDITTDLFPCRLDVLYGWAPLYPEWSVRIQS
jgi:hypothetical protein